MPCSWFGRFNIVKTGILLKLISVELLSKLQQTFFTETNKLILKFIRKCKWARIARAIFKKNKVVGLTTPNFKTHFKPTEIKTML